MEGLLQAGSSYFYYKSSRCETCRVRSTGSTHYRKTVE
ncbi:hypothetical protein V6Z11_D09G085900 [Gossypium hirsutum]